MRALDIKAEVAENDQPLFLDILDFINRPQQALFQVVESIQNGEDWETTLKETWQALEGRIDPIRFGDILRTAGMQDGKLLTAAGFAGDVVADPLNVLPVGVATKISKAARRALLATPKGRRAAIYATEVLREAPVVGTLNKYLHRWFVTGEEFIERPTEQVRGFIRHVEADIADLEAEGVAVIGKRVTIPGRRSPASAIEDIPVKTGLVVHEGMDLTKIKDINARMDVVRRMAEAHQEGRLPHTILGQWFAASKKNALIARQGMLTQWVPAIGKFMRDFVNPLDPEDQKLVMRVAEESGIRNSELAAQRVGDLLGKASDPDGVQRAAENLRKMIDDLEDIEEKAGVKVARLGGGLRARREEIFKATEELLGQQDFKAWNDLARTVRTTAFGSLLAQKQAFTLADTLEQLAKGNITKADVLGIMDEMPDLRGSLGEIREGKLAKVGKAAREHDRLRGSEFRSNSVWQVMVDDIVNPSIAAGREKVLKKRARQMERVQRLIDRVPGYVLHYMDDDTVDWLAKNVGKDSKIANALGGAGHRSMIERKWVDKNKVPLSLEEVREILFTEEEKLADLGRSILRRKRTWRELLAGKPAAEAEYFGLDPAAALAIRAQRTAQAISGQRFRSDVSRIFGNYRGVSDAVSIPGFSGKFAPEIGELLGAMDEAYFGDAATKSFLRFYDGAQMLWKGFSLFPFPAYHTRNAIGDLWLMSIGGFFTRSTAGHEGLFEPFWRAVPDFEAYFDLMRAYRMQTHIATDNIEALASIKLTLPSGETWSGTDLYEMMQRKGAIGIGFHSDNLQSAAEVEVKLTDGPWRNGKFNRRAIPEAMRSVADLRTWVMPSEMPRNAIIRSGRAVAASISDSHRMAFVMNRLRKGDTLDEAVNAAKKFLIDYSDMTPFETQIPRRAMPFYSWMRKNIPLELEALVDNPRRFARIGHLANLARDPDGPAQPFLSFLGGEGRGLKEDELPEPIDLPEWMRQAVPFPLRRNADGDLEVITAAAWHPAADIQRIAPESVGKTFVDQLSPLIKLPLETAMKRNFFFDQELEGSAEFLGREMPAWFANGLQNVRLLAEFDRMNWLSGTQFSTTRLRPETDETMLQKSLRFLTGAKIYPLDTRAAKNSNLAGVLDRNRIRLAKERSARRKEARRNADRER